MPRLITAVVVATLPSTRYITDTWTFTASVGSTPARINPTIAPGRNTIPTALVDSICGTSAVRNAWRKWGWNDSVAVRPEGQPRLDQVTLLGGRYQQLTRHEHRRRQRVADHHPGERHQRATLQVVDPETEQHAEHHHGRRRVRDQRQHQHVGHVRRPPRRGVHRETDHRQQPDHRIDQRVVGIDHELQHPADDQQLDERPERRPDQAALEPQLAPQRDPDGDRHEDRRRGQPGNADVTLLHSDHSRSFRTRPRKTGITAPPPIGARRGRRSHRVRRDVRSRAPCPRRARSRDRRADGADRCRG